MVFDDLAETVELFDVGMMLPVKISSYKLSYEPAERRDLMFDLRERSIKLFESQSEDERLIVKAAVIKTLSLLIDNFDHWYPASLRMDDVGETLTIEINLSSFERSIQDVGVDTITSKDIEVARRDALAIIDEFC